MKPNLLLAFTSLCFFITANAQFYYYNDRWYDKELLLEAGITTGAMNCITDLAGSKSGKRSTLSAIHPGFTRPSVGAFFSAVYLEQLGFRVDFNYGTVTAADSILKDKGSSRYLRNLHFRSRIADLSLILEAYPLALLGAPSTDLNPYLLTGFGAFWFNPKARLNGEMIALRPLRTEGQGFTVHPDRKQYSRIQVQLPVGFGVRYEVSARVSARLEFIYRFTSTDYLDDVSTSYIDPALFAGELPANLSQLAEKLHNRTAERTQLARSTINEIRGNPDKKDAYFSINFKLGLILNRVRR